MSWFEDRCYYSGAYEISSKGNVLEFDMKIWDIVDIKDYQGSKTIILSDSNREGLYTGWKKPLWDPSTLWLQTINFKIKKVIFNDPATIVLWKDGTKTVVICQEGDTYSKELGLAMCISKKALGNKGNFNDIFKEWVYE